MSELQLIMFSANLAFIITNLYGWFLKRYYVPAPFREHFKELYPAQKAVATLYLLQFFEIPYLINIGQPEALFYVNGTAVMFFSSFMYVLVKGYFFLEEFSPLRLLIFMLPVVIVWLALLLPVFGLMEFSETYQMVMFVIVSVVSASYVFFIVVNVWFVYYTLNPHRTVHHVLEKAPKFRLTENKSKEIEAKMEQVAMESGFSSGSAFSQVFKRIKGVTPKEFVNAE